MNEELRPCPFCGGEATLISKDYYIAYFVECVNDHCFGSVKGDTEEEVITLWNTRPIENALNKRIAELEGLVDELVNIGDNLFDSLNPIAWKHEWLDKWWKLSSCRRGERE